MYTENATATQGNEVSAPAKTAVPKKAAKKVAKKTAKKAAVKVAKKEVEPIKATSIEAAIKEARKQGLKRGVVSVNGKKYAITIRSTWAITKNLINDGNEGAGLIMFIEEEGFYVYPKAKFNELFGKIYKSGTWKKIGIYSQSTLPQWHADYFTKKK